MIPNEKGQQLHDRVTRGEELSPEEKQLLEEWYAVQDQAEADLLGLNEQEPFQVQLQAQIQEALAQLVKTANRIQQIASEIEVIRKENATLRRQLAQQLGSPS